MPRGRLPDTPQLEEMRRVQVLIVNLLLQVLLEALPWKDGDGWRAGAAPQGREEGEAGVHEQAKPLPVVVPPTQNIWLLQRAAASSAPTGTRRAEGSVCTVHMRPQPDTGPGRLLEVSGVLTGYESAFLEDVRWGAEDLGLFGLCGQQGPLTALTLLTQLAAHLAAPEDHRLIVLHLEEVKWDKETKLQFQVLVEEDGFPLEELSSALLVFYLEGKGHPSNKHRVTLAAAGGTHHPKQAVCLSGGTRYLALAAESTHSSFSQGKLRFALTLQLWHNEKGVALIEDVQQWLFGTDDKCFTRMTPALFLLVKRTSEVKKGSLLASPISQADGDDPDAISNPQPRLPADIKEEASILENHGKKSSLGHTDAFLEILVRFVGQVLITFKEQPKPFMLPIQTDNQTIESITSSPLNVSGNTAIEWLVETEEPLVFLFPKGSQSLLERDFVQGKLEGKLLEKLMGKLNAVLEELVALPAIQDNAKLLKDLLDYCYGSFNLSSLPGAGGGARKVRGPGHKKLHSLLLLKALQTVRVYWQKRSKLSRQNRSASSKASCRLQELTMMLQFDHEAENIFIPPKYVAYNCVGTCKLPQDTQSETNNHVILLIKMRESGADLGRNPCCVPEKYGKLYVGTMTADGLDFRPYPNMIAEQCGCR